MKLYKYNIRDLSDSEYNKWFSLMREDKQKKVNRLRFDDDKKRTVAGEMLARKAVAEFCLMPAEDIIFGKNEHGKPFAENAKAEFNISHSEETVVCAVSDKPIGVDIEQIRPIDLNIAKRVCSKTEMCHIFGHDPDEDDFKETADIEVLTRFFEIWTAKEAYLKCIGTGIVDDLKTLSVNESKIRKEAFENYIITIFEE